MKRIEWHAIALVALIFGAGIGPGCSSPQEKPDPVTQEAAPEPPPECLNGCMIAGNGECQVEANSMDWNSSGTEIVACDPRCCEAGVDNMASGGPDTDDDGIVDETDKCPGEAEDFDQFEDEDGCPDLDNDGDGIADADDLCPLDAEDVDGFQDQDGCLDP